MYRWTVSVFVVALVGACAPATPPASHAPAEEPTAVVPPAQGEQASAAQMASPLTAQSPGAANQNAAPVATQAAPATDQAAPADEVQADAQTATVERLLLFTPDGPLIVHLQIFLHGEPQRSAVERLLDEALQAIGAASGAPSWADLMASPALASGQFGNAPLAGAKQQEIKQQFDVNRDGRVQRSELAALLSQDNARGRAFAVRSVKEFQGEGTQNSPLFALLDQDRDGRISATEMAASVTRLRSRDADDDDVVVISDLRRPASSEQALRHRNFEFHQAIELTRSAADPILYTLRDFYEEKLPGAASFRITPSLLAELDLDRNGVVTPDEIVEMMNARPDLLLKVNFGGPPAAAEPEIQLQGMSDDLSSAAVGVERELGRLTIDLPQSQLAVSAVEAVAEGENSKLSLDESKQATDKRRSYKTLQVQARVGPVEDSLFDWLDVNRDARLTGREMMGAPERLTQLDRDGDGALTPPEIPDRLALVILRGAAWDDPLFGPAGAPRALASAAPEWWTAMDQNGDGEVSAREFLGKPEVFAKFDLNSDGFLDASEALQAEAAPN